MQAVCDTPIARITGLCVLMKDLGRRLNLQLLIQCSYQEQQGDVSQSVRENIKPVSEGDKIWQLWKEMREFIKWILQVE